MPKTKLNALLALGVLIAVLLACNFTTANLRSFKISKDEAGKSEASTFRPGEKVYAIAEVANNGGKVETKFRVVYDQVDGQKSGELVQGAEKTLEIEGNRPAIFWVTLPPQGFDNGRYKVEVTMLKDGEEKDKKSATFEVTGF
jgi:hypothetical protein